MATTSNQNVQQAVVRPGSTVRPGQNAVQLELFDRDGRPWDAKEILDRLEALENG